MPCALPSPVVQCLLDGAAAMDASAFHRAGVGRGQEHIVNNFVRRDQVAWIEADDESLALWLGWAERLRLHLNRHLFLGLFSFESHYAVYEPGDFYKRHRDAFKGESNRVLSVVTYLNAGWEPGHGGELVLYPETGEAINVIPALGTLVVFLSEDFPHEVLPAERERLSVAGWFRLNTSILGEIDPPQ